MRRKAVEKLIDARIARQVAEASFAASRFCHPMMATNSEVKWLVEQEVGLALRELDEAVETMYRNGGDRRSDPNRADRVPK